jgi:hypothetical protein
MKISIDWDRRERKINSNKKKEPEKPRNIKKTSSKSKSPSSVEKIGPEFINSIKFNHTPGKFSIEIGYSLDNQDEDQQDIHVKSLNREQIQGLKRFLNIFDN